MNLRHFEAFYPPETREHEIEKLLQFVKEGNSGQLIGIPGSGRSNVIGLFSYNRSVREKHLGENQKWSHFVYVNLSEVRGKPLLEATKLMFLELVESLLEREKVEEYQKTQEIFKESLSFNDELVLSQGLKRAVDYLAIEKELTIVFLFDRFEEYIPVLTSDFFSNLRVLRNRAKYRFSAFFSLSRPLEDSLEPILLADFYEFVIGHHIYTSLFDIPGFLFRVSYLEKISGKTLSKETLEKITSLTSGHGKLTRLSSELCLSEDIQAEVLTSSLLLSKKTMQGALFEIWNFLSPVEQEGLTSTVEKKSSFDSTFLEQISLLQDGKITIPLFKDFLQKQFVSDLESKKEITFDADTNTIKKGHETLSDKLTLSEFRLLRLLLESPDKVLEREEIIKSVWQDSKSVAGVTDQAVDQLVFRLRKKIETDLNHPQYIQTVKGRGIKLVNS